MEIFVYRVAAAAPKFSVSVAKSATAFGTGGMGRADKSILAAHHAALRTG